MPRQRDRESGQGLLPGMEARPWADGKTVTYRFHPYKGKPIALGTDREAALRKVLDLTGRSEHHGSLRWVWDQWQSSKRCQRLADGTRADYALAWKQIEPHLGKLPVAAITSPMVARYVHITRADSPRRADIEKALLSNLFKHGIMLGVCEVNATIGVEPHGSDGGERKMPETAALRAFLAWLDRQTPQRRVIGLMAEFASLSGSRRTEFLALSETQVDEKAGVLRTFRAKQRGKKRETVVDVIALSPALRSVLARIRELKAERGHETTSLFTDRDGNAYGERAFKTLWQRCVQAAIDEKVITPAQRFNFHALRHYYTTVHKAERGALPNLHANPAITARVYDETIEERRDAI